MEYDLQRRFEQTVLIHFAAAYNMARWLTRNPADAEDVVQEAFLRAFKYFHDSETQSRRPWLLTIVRNTFNDFYQQQKFHAMHSPLNEAQSEEEHGWPNPEEEFVKAESAKELQNLLMKLPRELREAIVLREIEGFSYKEIATTLGVPIGTVMSRLSRGRNQLVTQLRPITSKP